MPAEREKVIRPGRGVKLSLTPGNKYTIMTSTAKVAILEMEDVTFGFDRSILLPAYRFDGTEKELEDRITGLGVIKAALKFANYYPAKKLLIAGHTDSSGSDTYNLGLSRRRAASVFLYLSGQKEEWAKNCQNDFETDDFQAILKWVALTKDWDCDPGKIDNKFGSQTRDARNNFRKTFNEVYDGDLKIGVKQNTADWMAFFHVYDRALCKLMDIEETELSKFRGSLNFTTPPTIGCGENFPREDDRLDEKAGHSNRRVEMLFFDRDELPHFADENIPGELIYGGGYEPEYLPVEIADPKYDKTLRFKFFVDVLNPSKQKEIFFLESGDGAIKQSRRLSEANVKRNHLEMVFTELDRHKKYSMKVGYDNIPDKKLLFSDLTFKELKQLELNPGEK